MPYFYESHMGGIYTTDEERDFDDLYCETCGDSDTYIGYAATKTQARKIIKNSLWGDTYAHAYIKQLLDITFAEVAE